MKAEGEVRARRLFPLLFYQINKQKARGKMNVSTQKVAKMGVL